MVLETLVPAHWAFGFLYGRAWWGIAEESCAHGSQKVEQEEEVVQTPVLSD